MGRFIGQTSTVVSFMGGLHRRIWLRGGNGSLIWILLK